MENVPDHLRIKVIYKDEAIVLIDKPCNLRSVPGHANPPPTAAHLTRANSEKENRFTCQETWTQAILSFNNDEADDTASKWLSALSRTPNPSSIPRKWGPFRRYVHRNQRRLNQMDDSDKVKPMPKQTIDDTKIDEIVNEMYERIRKQQVPLMNLPEATSNEESAFGQLILLGYGNDNESGKPNCRRNHMGLYVVHRLDCETSGIMVFARNQDSASKLCQFWRGRGQVTKVYLAKVKEWKPYQEEQTLEGRIDLPLAPSEERLKWKVAMTTGKPSVTLWKLHNPPTGAEPNSIMVELTPLTGRTHQLRVHCASVGSPIEGDSLYGNEKIHWDPMQPDGLMLCLHAHELSFTHPASDEIMKFTSMPSWYEASATCG